MAYFVLATVVRNQCSKTDMITLLSVVIFALHQVQTFLKIDPFTNVSR
jgi:hypothetical protein